MSAAPAMMAGPAMAISQCAVEVESSAVESLSDWNDMVTFRENNGGGLGRNYARRTIRAVEPPTSFILWFIFLARTYAKAVIASQSWKVMMWAFHLGCTSEDAASSYLNYHKLIYSACIPVTLLPWQNYVANAIAYTIFPCWNWILWISNSKFLGFCLHNHSCLYS